MPRIYSSNKERKQHIEAIEQQYPGNRQRPELAPGIRVLGRSKVNGTEVEIYAASMTLRCTARYQPTRLSKKTLTCGRLILANQPFTGGSIQTAACDKCKRISDVSYCSAPNCRGSLITATSTRACEATGCPEYWAAQQAAKEKLTAKAPRASKRKAAAS